MCMARLSVYVPLSAEHYVTHQSGPSMWHLGVLSCAPSEVHNLGQRYMLYMNNSYP
jgi:hypothetical protein